MSFTITRDLICDGPADSCVGTVVDEMPLYGVERIMGEDGAIPSGLPKARFRLYDDDEELYYEGELDDDDSCDNQMAALRWGETMAGCAIIRVNRPEQGANSWVQEIA